MPAALCLHCACAVASTFDRPRVQMVASLTIIEALSHYNIFTGRRKHGRGEVDNLPQGGYLGSSGHFLYRYRLINTNIHPPKLF